MPSNMDKAFQIQRQARDNVKTLQTYLTDLQNWEVEMKRKEAALNGDLEQDLPPVRSKVRREKPVQVPKKREERIRASDYSAWEKFDVEKACEEVDTAEMGPASLDSKKSQSVKAEKLREEAQYEKERGNAFVKQERWEDAIACYGRAIALAPDQAVYYANRGLCHLKRDSLQQAETDCTEALRLDPAYVKALQRRAAARERLGSLRAAARDLQQVLELEPRNAAARRHLADVRARMGTKGAKSKTSSPTSPPGESGPAPVPAAPPPPAAPPAAPPPQSPLDRWRRGADEPVTVIEPVKKPPHLRSKRALERVPIREVPLGRRAGGRGDDGEDGRGPDDRGGGPPPAAAPSPTPCPAQGPAPGPRRASAAPPANSVQFMAEWRRLQGDDDARSEYLSRIEPGRLPGVFAHALESAVLSGVLRALHAHRARFRPSLAAYLQQLSRARRFPALAMFLTAGDKDLLSSMLVYCQEAEGLDAAGVAALRSAYEL